MSKMLEINYCVQCDHLDKHYICKLLDKSIDKPYAITCIDEDCPLPDYPKDEALPLPRDSSHEQEIKRLKEQLKSQKMGW